MIKTYTVMGDTNNFETDIKTLKTFRYRKAAEKYGLKLVEKCGHCNITTYINGEKNNFEQY